MVAQKINVQIQPVKTSDTAGQVPRPLVSCRLFLFVKGTVIAIFDHVITPPLYGSLGNPNNIHIFFNGDIHAIRESYGRQLMFITFILLLYF